MSFLNHDTDKINRQVHYPYAQAFDSEDKGDNNDWTYNRAPNGYRFILDSISVIASATNNQNNGIVQIYEGHEHTDYIIYPGVESREILERLETTDYQLNLEKSLHGWDCKEYTLGVRSTSETYAYRVIVIVWYYLQKMTAFERLHFAVTQSKSIKGRFPKAFRTTVEPTEDED